VLLKIFFAQDDEIINARMQGADIRDAVLHSSINCSDYPTFWI